MARKMHLGFHEKGKRNVSTYWFARPAWYTFVSVWSLCSLGARLSPRTGGSSLSCLSLDARGTRESRGAHQSLQDDTKMMKLACE